MKRIQITTLLFVIFCMTWIVITVVPVRASTLVEWVFKFNEDPVFWSALDLPSDLPGTFDVSGFDWDSGLGTITVSVFGVGPNSFHAFFDHEIVETDNTFFNEFGAVSGTPATGQTWEIDEPGYYFGDSRINAASGTLDNSNGVPSGFENDVSMAMGWGFTLNPGETALITLVLGTNIPEPGFYLSQTDPDSGETIYFSSGLDVRSAAVPEPGTWLLMGTGIMSLAALRFRLRLRRKSKIG